MKLATFNITSSGKRTLGAFQNDRYVDLVARSGGDIPASMLEFLQAGDAAMDAARASLASDSTDDTYGSDQVTLESPVPLPGKIVHTSCNFDSHLAELATWDDPEWESHNWGDFHFEHRATRKCFCSDPIGSRQALWQQCINAGNHMNCEIEVDHLALRNGS